MDKEPTTTADLLTKLHEIYGSSHAVNEAARELWQGEKGERLMLKVDALWMLYQRNQLKENQNDSSN